MQYRMELDEVGNVKIGLHLYFEHSSASDCTLVKAIFHEINSHQFTRLGPLRVKICANVEKWILIHFWQIIKFNTPFEFRR